MCSCLIVMNNHESICFKVEKTKQELKSKDVQSKKMEDTIHGLDLKLKDKDLKIKSLQDKVLFRELCCEIVNTSENFLYRGQQLQFYSCASCR